MYPVQHFNEDNGTQCNLIRKEYIAPMKVSRRAYGPFFTLQRLRSGLVQRFVFFATLVHSDTQRPSFGRIGNNIEIRG